MGSRVDLKDSSPLKLASTYNVTKLIRLADGHHYRVQALPFGTWVHPGDTDRRLIVDRTVVGSIVKNFNDRVLDTVPVPWTHTDDPKENTGNVVAAMETADGLDLVLDTPLATEKIDQGLVGGVSLSIDFNYMDKKSGKDLGPTMLHAALVSNPYIKGMRKFTKLDAGELDALGIKRDQMRIAAGDKSEPLFLAEKPDIGATMPTVLKDLLDALKAEHNIDVAKLQETDKAHVGMMTQLRDIGKLFGLTVEKPEQVGALSEKAKTASEAVVELAEIRAAVIAKVQLADGQKLKDVIAKQVTETVALTDRIVLIEAERDVDVLLADKKILPAQRDHFIELRKSNKSLYDKMTAGLKANAAVDLSERGTDTSTETGDVDADKKSKGSVKLSDADAKKETDRYAEMAAKNRAPGLAGIISHRRQPVTVGSGKN